MLKTSTRLLAASSPSCAGPWRSSSIRSTSARAPSPRGTQAELRRCFAYRLASDSGLGELSKASRSFNIFATIILEDTSAASNQILGNVTKEIRQRRQTRRHGHLPLWATPRSWACSLLRPCLAFVVLYLQDHRGICYHYHGMFLCSFLRPLTITNTAPLIGLSFNKKSYYDHSPSYAFSIFSELWSQAITRSTLVDFMIVHQTRCHLLLIVLVNLVSSLTERMVFPSGPYRGAFTRCTIRGIV